ncbi:unnamed protein product, partial [Symbiodinium sp. CCMP2456]
CWTSTGRTSATSSGGALTCCDSSELYFATTTSPSLRHCLRPTASAGTTSLAAPMRLQDPAKVAWAWLSLVLAESSAEDEVRTVMLCAESHGATPRRHLGLWLHEASSRESATLPGASSQDSAALLAVAGDARRRHLGLWLREAILAFQWAQQ